MTYVLNLKLRINLTHYLSLRFVLILSSHLLYGLPLNHFTPVFFDYSFCLFLVHFVAHNKGETYLHIYIYIYNIILYSARQHNYFIIKANTRLHVSTITQSSSGLY